VKFGSLCRELGVCVVIRGFVVAETGHRTVQSPVHCRSSQEPQPQSHLTPPPFHSAHDSLQTTPAFFTCSGLTENMPHITRQYVLKLFNMDFYFLKDSSMMRSAISLQVSSELLFNKTVIVVGQHSCSVADVSQFSNSVRSPQVLALISSPNHNLNPIPNHNLRHVP